jgi:hypothetical protein
MRMIVNKKNRAPALNPYTVLILGIVAVSTGSIFARRYIGCGLPALRAKFTPQTFPITICCHLL